MKKTITFIVSLTLITLIVGGCSDEGQSLDGQKQIQFSLTQKGSNENWEVTDNIEGEYYNIEKIVYSTHELKIIPKKEVDYKFLTITLKIGDEVVGFYVEESSEKNKFNAELNQQGNYQITQENFIHTNGSNTFWGENVTIVIEYSDKKEEIKLG